MLGPTGRLLRLLSLLQSGQEWSGAELAERLECSSRTVRREVDRLRELGYPIEASRGSAGYRLRAGSELPPLLLGDDEAVAVMIGLQTAAARGVTGMEEAAGRALAKLGRLLPFRLRHQVTALEAVAVPSPTAGTTVDPSLLTLVAGAGRDRQRLGFDYTDHGGATSRRSVEPHQLVHTGRRWYLVAYDLGRDDWRSFRLDRVARPSPPGAHFTPRAVPGGDAVAFVTQGVTSQLWPHHARARLHAPAEVVADRLPSTTKSLVAVDDRTSVLDLGADSLADLAAYLCRLDVDFDIEEAPDGLAAQLRSLIGRLQRVV